MNRTSSILEPIRSLTCALACACACALPLAVVCAAAPEALAAKTKPSKSKQAEELSWKALKLHRAGQYREAAELFLQAYELTQHPSQLRNAAKDLEQAGLLDDALARWHEYRQHPKINPDERGEAEANIALILERQKGARIAKEAEQARAAAAAAAEAEAKRRAEAAAAAQAAPAAPASSAAPAASVSTTAVPEPAGAGWAPWVVSGAGAALVVVSGVLWFSAQSDLDDVESRLAMRDASGRIVGIGPAEVESKQSSINTGRNMSVVALGVGAGAIATGVLWWLLDSGGSRSSDDASEASAPPVPEREEAPEEERKPIPRDGW